MSENIAIEKEKNALKTLIEVEDLAEKKAKIYSRLLTDAALAKDMESLAARHAKRKQTLQALALGKMPKKGKNGGMSETNGEETGK